MAEAKLTIRIEDDGGRPPSPPRSPDPARFPHGLIDHPDVYAAHGLPYPGKPAGAAGYYSYASAAPAGKAFSAASAPSAPSAGGGGAGSSAAPSGPAGRAWSDLDFDSKLKAASAVGRPG